MYRLKLGENDDSRKLDELSIDWIHGSLNYNISSKFVAGSISDPENLNFTLHEVNKNYQNTNRLINKKGETFLEKREEKLSLFFSESEKLYSFLQEKKNKLLHFLRNKDLIPFFEKRGEKEKEKKQVFYFRVRTALFHSSRRKCLLPRERKRKPPSLSRIRSSFFPEK